MRVQTVAAGVLLSLCHGCASIEAVRTPSPIAETATPQTETTVEQTQPEAAAAIANAPMDSRRLRIASVGDIMIGTDYPQNHLPDDDGAGFLRAVTPVLRDADITVGNLEGVLMDGGIPRKQCKTASACYLFRMPSRYARYFVEAGFDVMSTANNHSRDFGEEGRTETMQNLARAGILHTGREGDFAEMTVDGLRIAVLGYAVTLESNLVLDYDVAAETVARFAATHDIVVITFHAGAEGPDVSRIPFAEETYFGEMRGDVVKFARMMVDAGADLVVGHGPHVVRGMENYKGRLIAYSLGNFATYYGISVEGDRGVAPILTATLDAEGRFVEAMIHSTQQIRPAGPSLDPEQKARTLLETLSLQDFARPGIHFLPNGGLLPEERSLDSLTNYWSSSLPIERKSTPRLLSLR